MARGGCAPQWSGTRTPQAGALHAQPASGAVATPPDVGRANGNWQRRCLGYSALTYEMPGGPRPEGGAPRRRNGPAARAGDAGPAARPEASVPGAGGADGLAEAVVLVDQGLARLHATGAGREA